MQYRKAPFYRHFRPLEGFDPHLFLCIFRLELLSLSLAHNNGSLMTVAILRIIEKYGFEHLFIKYFLRGT